MEILAGIQPVVWLAVIGVIFLIFILVTTSINRRGREELSKLQEEINYLERVRNREASVLIQEHQKVIAGKDKLHKDVLAKMKKIHEDRTGEIRKEFDVKLETIRMEASEYAKDFKQEKKQERRVLSKAVIDRAEKFPMMLGCLKGMADQMQKLKDITHRNDVDAESGEEPEAFDSFDEMNAIIDRITVMHRYFEELRTEMRPYLINTDYKLPRQTSSFITDYRRGKQGTLPHVTDDDIYFYYVLMGVDIMVLTNDLYGFGNNRKITDNIDWSLISREHEFKKGVLARRGFRLDD